MSGERDDDVDDRDREHDNIVPLDRCCIAGCKRIARGLYCDLHLALLARLDRDDEREPPRAALTPGGNNE
jgi:hypothetical protein